MSLRIALATFQKMTGTCRRRYLTTRRARIVSLPRLICLVSFWSVSLEGRNMEFSFIPSEIDSYLCRDSAIDFPSIGSYFIGGLCSMRNAQPNKATTKIMPAIKICLRFMSAPVPSNQLEYMVSHLYAEDVAIN